MASDIRNVSADATGPDTQEDTLTSMMQGIVRELGEKTKELQQMVAQRETRINQMEASVKRALEEFFPRVDAMLQKLEVRPNTVSRPSTSNIRQRALSLDAPSTSSSAAARTAIRPLTFEQLEARRQALFRAALSGRIEDVRRIVEQGDNVLFPEGNLPSGTPLHCAVRKGYVDIVIFLLNVGANPNAQTSSGQRPLDFAARRGTERMLQVLIAGGGHVNAVDSEGNTPLHWAARRGQEAVIRTLVAAGANKASTDRWGRIPYDLASNQIREMLKP